MTGTSGAVAPSEGESAPVAGLTDEAIDGAIEQAEPSAEDKVRTLEKELNEYRARTRAQEEMIGGLRGEVGETKRLAAEQGEAVRELLDRSRGAEDRGFQYEAARIEAGMRKAVENADTPTYDALRMELDGLYRQRAEKQKKPAETDKDKPNGQKTAADPAAAAWVRDNPWFSTDKKLHRAAIAIEATIMEDEPHLSTAERLKKTKEEIVQRFPEKFENQARRQPSAVSTPGGQLTRPARPKVLTISDLDEDSKAALAAIKATDPKFTDEMYLKARQKRLAQDKEKNRL